MQIGGHCYGDQVGGSSEYYCWGEQPDCGWACRLKWLQTGELDVGEKKYWINACNMGGG